MQRKEGCITTQTNEIHREDMCASSHTFHLLVSSGLGTLLVSVGSMRMENHKGQKASRFIYLYLCAFKEVP